MKRFTALFFAILLSAAVLTVLPIHGESEIYDNVIRIHVLANSDSEEDQRLKLAVRDRVNTEAARITSGCREVEEAEAALRAELPRIISAAEKALAEEGSTLEVSAELGRERYPTREYEDMRFPAGEYTSLRIMLGAAEGKNWWCVLFPPLCLVGAADAREELTEAGFTPGQIGLLTDSENPKYVLRFKLLEIFAGLF